MEHEERDIWSVAALNRYIRGYLEEDVTLHHLWVRGEISNFKHHSRGHMYFTLKDESSRISAVMFARQNRHLRFSPQNGDNVLVRGSVSMYEIGGVVQLYVKEMQPDGIGSLFLAYEQLKQKLEAEGLFREERKRALPPYPRTVGVVTSPTGAAVRDIVTTIERRAPSTNVLLIPALVQGDNAAASIVRAIEYANASCKAELDVLIVGRGGGSLEELWAFNEEKVVRSIYASDIPVIAAVGHETDVTLADFVADVRAATPTAAAELAVPAHAELKQRVEHLFDRLRTTMERAIQTARERLNRCQQSPVMKRPAVQWREYEQRLDYLHTTLTRAVFEQLQRKAHTLERYTDRIRINELQMYIARLQREHSHTYDRLLTAITRLCHDKQIQLSQHIRQLDALSPLKVMQRGYSLVYREEDNRLVKSIDAVDLGDIVHVHVSNGRLDCQVWGMEEKSREGK